MNIKNSQVRAQARRLLDDNIFGKDWLKGALVQVMITALVFVITDLFSSFASQIITILLRLITVESLIIQFGIPLIIYLALILVTFALMGPISVGTASVYIDLVRKNGNVKIRKFFYGFRDFVGNALLGLMYALQITLWSFFFVLPGIYIAYSYALVFHVKKDHPEYRWKTCLDESERLMEGNRWKLFKLQISHLGWFLLSMAFVFFGSFWTAPYYNTSIAIFYDEVRASKGSR